MYTTSILILLASAGLIDSRSVFEARHAEVRHLHHLTHKRLIHDSGDIVLSRELAHRVHDRAAGDASVTTLAASAIQSGSFVDGTKEIGANVAQQAPSLTSQNNFINVCAGKVLTNGLQITTGSCNGITMGDIPAKNLMVSSMITFPLQGSASIQSDTTFTITVQMSNLVAGSFTNADATYYSAPQALSGGQVVGHTHVTVQDMGATLNPTKALDPTKFAFFKGINDVGNGQGLLSAVVTGGLPAGNYRVCTLASSSNHQPVIMPVAQRGTVDDCTKFTVIGNGNVANDASDSGVKGIAAAAAVASAIANGAGNPDPALSATSSSIASAFKTTTTAKANGNGGGKAVSTASAKTTPKATSQNTNKGKGNNAATSTSESACTLATSTVFVDSPSATSIAVPVTSSTASAALAVSTKSATALGGISAPAITDSGDASRPFLVNGNTFVNKSAAVQRSCDIQFNLCANAVNGGKLSGSTLANCQAQETTCTAAAAS